MTRVVPRSRVLTPLVYVVALVLLFEEWCWAAGMRLTRALACLPWLDALEAQVRRLPAWAALCAFVLPGMLLLPVKLLALVAIAHGHPMSGIATIVAAKVGGAAVVARLYALTLPTLLTIGWFARGYDRFVVIKTRCIARLCASPMVVRGRALLAGMRIGLRRTRRRMRWGMRRRMGGGAAFGSRHAGRTVRALRRFAALWRARRR